MKTKFRQSKSKNINDTQPEWWDQTCSDSKSRKIRALRKFRDSNPHEDFVSYKIEWNHFKSLCRIKKRELQKKREYFWSNPEINLKTSGKLLKAVKQILQLIQMQLVLAIG